MEPDIWMVMDRVMQWLILPALGVIWAINTRIGKHEKEILRIMTILEERNRRREEDREDVSATFKQLREAITALAEKIDNLADNRR